MAGLLDIPGYGGFLQKGQLNQQQAMGELQGVLGQINAMQNMQQMQRQTAMQPYEMQKLQAQAQLAQEQAKRYGPMVEMERLKMEKMLRQQEMLNGVLSSIFPQAGGSPAPGGGMPQMQTAGMPDGQMPVQTVGMPGAQPVASPVKPLQQPFPLNPTQAMALGFADKNMGEMAFKGIGADRDARKPPETRAPGSWYIEPETGLWRQLANEKPPLATLIERYQNAASQMRQTGVDYRPNIERTIRSMYPKEADDFFGTAQGGGTGGQTPAAAAPMGPTPEGMERTRQELNQAWIKSTYEPIKLAARSAEDGIAAAESARESMRRMGGTGFGVALKAEGARILEGLGVASEKAKELSANTTIFEKAVLDRSWALLNAAKGVQTEGDAARSMKAWAQLKNTPLANEYILDLYEAIERRKILHDAFVDNALQTEAGRANHSMIDREWRRKMPSIHDMPSMQRWKATQPK